MKKINSFLFALLGILLLVSCDNKGLKKTKSGLLYKIISDEKNPLVKRGQFIKLSFNQKIRDSLLFTSDSSMPAYVRIDSVSANAYSPVEVFPLLRKGDSAVIIQLADSIRRKSQQPLPPFIHKNDKIVLNLRVLDVFTDEVSVQKDRTEAMDAFHAKQMKVIENYLQEHNIQATKTGDGVYVEIKNPGTGASADSGKQISVIYTGKTFPAGKVFETNDKEDGQPIKFVIGERKIIQGWDEGIRLLKKGGTATLYIPAFLAYDQQPAGPSKKPNENLIFDVRVVDVTDAPAAEAMPQRSMMPGFKPNARQASPPPAHK
jgi:FKBP-type peptidyl-prolyl cis-trans isomerase FkpA